MMFHSPVFILCFLPVCLSGFFTLGRTLGTTSALCWLIAASLVFYGWWNPVDVPLLIGSVLANYAVARTIRRSARPRGWMMVGVGLNLALLGWFKYADFLLHVVMPTAPPLGIGLPLAISFFTFQQIMFVVDTARARDTERVHDHLTTRPRITAAFDAPPPDVVMVAEGPPPTPLPRSAPQGVGGPPPGLHRGHASRTMTERGRCLAPDAAVIRDQALSVRGELTAASDARSSLIVMAGEGEAGRHLPVSAPAEPPPPSHGRPPTTTVPAARAPLEGLGGQQTAFLSFAAFVTFFPHLIAGPIVRPAEIIPQLTARDLGRLRMDNLTEGLLIFLLGLAKKCVLADMFGGFADTGFGAASHGTALTFFEAWYATLSYALQIYFDFSGYSDMATGLARMLNIRFPLNFDSPYQATDIGAFWRRWNITLGAFLRDYLYIPLGGNRAGPLRQTANLMATMLLAGLWHGAAWNFVAWGGLQGLFLVIHRQYRRLFPPLPAALGQALTLLAVILAWVPFRAGSLTETLAILRGMAGLNGIALPRMIVSAFPLLGSIAEPVAVLPSLGDGRTLSFPEVSACLLLGWLIVLIMPNVHRMTERLRYRALTVSFAFSVQAAFFAPHVAPFLYFQF